MRTKPFDLQKALAGHPVVTCDGRKVIRMAHFPEASVYSVSALIDGEDEPFTFTESGRYLHYRDFEYDLLLEVKAVKRWARMVMMEGKPYVFSLWDSKEDAEGCPATNGFKVLPAYEYEVEE